MNILFKNHNEDTYRVIQFS